MADMELVIKIPEWQYRTIKENNLEMGISTGITINALCAIQQSTPLPKGHGKIVDIGKIDNDRIERDNPIICLTVNGEYIEAVSLDYLNSLPAIIEAESHCEVDENGKDG